MVVSANHVSRPLNLAEEKKCVDRERVVSVSGLDAPFDRGGTMTEDTTETSELAMNYLEVSISFSTASTFNWTYVRGTAAPDRDEMGRDENRDIPPALQARPFLKITVLGTETS